jgi:signal transduction histidine kinase
LLGELVEAWQAQAAAHGARLRLRDCRDHPLVRGRRLRLAQAIGNLIANANEHGGGDTEVTCWVDMTTVVVEIRDQGPGLPAPLGDLAGGRRARWATWCRTGARGHASSRRGHGLAVATEVAAAHGGRLVAPASPGGARLVLELPKAVRDDAPELSAARPDP